MMKNQWPTILSRYEIVDSSDIVILEVRENLNYAELPLLKQILDGEIQEGRNRLILNLCNVKMLYSTQMGTLISAMKKLRKEGGDLKICSIRPEVLAVFSSLDFAKIIDIHENESSAIEAFSKRS